MEVERLEAATATLMEPALSPRSCQPRRRDPWHRSSAATSMDVHSSQGTRVVFRPARTFGSGVSAFAGARCCTGEATRVYVSLAPLPRKGHRPPRARRHLHCRVPVDAVWVRRGWKMTVRSGRAPRRTRELGHWGKRSTVPVSACIL